jgi:hypothetical protein
MTGALASGGKVRTGYARAAFNQACMPQLRNSHLKTQIFEKAQEIDLFQYDATEYAPLLRGFVEYFLAESKKGLEPERIGEVVHTALTARRPKLRYAVVPQPFKNWILPRIMPKRVLDRAIGMQSGLLPPEMRRAQIAG